MKLRQLNYFVAIADQKSFLKASLILHVSQPTISSQIKLLEEELNVVLFERSFEGSILTPEGRDFLIHARTVLNAIEAATSSMRVYQSEEVGCVSIGIPGSLTSILTVPLIETVMREMPNVRFRVASGLSGHITRWILEGTIDFGLIYGTHSFPELDIECFLEEKLFIAAKNRAALEPYLNNAGEFPVQNLAGLPLVLPGRDHGLRMVIEETTGKAGVGLNVIAELDASEQLKEIVRRRGCFTLLSLAALQNDIGDGALAMALIVKPSINRVVSFAHTSGRPLSRAARRVENIVRSLLTEELGKGWWKTARRIADAPQLSANQETMT